MEGWSGHPGCFGSASCHMQGPCEHSGTEGVGGGNGGAEAERGRERQREREAEREREKNYRGEVFNQRDWEAAWAREKLAGSRANVHKTVKRHCKRNRNWRQNKTGQQNCVRANRAQMQSKEKDRGRKVRSNFLVQQVNVPLFFPGAWVIIVLHSDKQIAMLMIETGRTWRDVSSVFLKNWTLSFTDLRHAAPIYSDSAFYRGHLCHWMKSNITVLQ